MSRAPIQASIAYFGKIPSRGDFVKAAESAALISVLDDWLVQAMELLAEDPRWKILYDTVDPIRFCFIGPNRKHAVAGHLTASRDQAHRRFPFLLMSTMHVDAPADFAAMSPMALMRLWNRLETMVDQVTREEDPTAALQTIGSASVSIESDPAAYEAALTDFLEFQTMGGSMRC